MANADVKKLDKELFEYLKKTAGDFREFYSDKKTHVIHLDLKETIEQCWEEMARREGYSKISLFRAELKNRGGEADSLLEKEINLGSKHLLKRLMRDLTAAQSKKDWSIELSSNVASKFTVTMSSLKGNPASVFKKFKEFKAIAQKPLIHRINKWSKKYSNRGKKGPLEKKSPIIRRKVYDAQGKASGSNDPFIDVGHMEGSEIGKLRILAAKDFLKNWEADSPQARAAKANALKGLKRAASWIYTVKTSFKGELEKSVEATLESSQINKASMSKGEVAGLNKHLQSAIGSMKFNSDGKWVENKTSDSFIDMAEKVVVNSIAKDLEKNPKVKIRTKVRYRNRKGSKKTVKGQKRVMKAKGLKNPTYMKVALTRLKQDARDAGGTASMQPLAMIGLINKELPAVVEANMGRPRLESITGRLAGSARVTDIITTAQGFPSIGYTYQLDPYQTFETGGKQGSTDYDPRRLIDQSLRQIAIKFAMGRFYTRREQ